MSLLPIGFLSPWILLAGLLLPVIWWLLRITPPAPEHVFFPATRLLLGINKDKQDSAHSPWWLTLLRLLAAAAIILALARPILNPQTGSLEKSDLLVVLVDNGWAAAGNWGTRYETLVQLLDQAEQNNRPVLVKSTTDPDPRASFTPLSAFAARKKIATLVPQPFAPERLKLLKLLEKNKPTGKKISYVWLSDGLDYGKASAFADGLVKLASGPSRLTVINTPKGAGLPLTLFASINKKGNLQATIKGLDGIAHKGHVIAIDAKGRPLLEKAITLEADQKKAVAIFDLPLELRNQVTRVKLKGLRSAGTTFLVDGRANWQRIGLVSGEAVEESQPLLSPLYYIKKALKPYSEITIADDRNTSKALHSLLSNEISTLILAGIGRLETAPTQKLESWLRRGGILIRFAGPRLEQGGDRLLPVPLRSGGRTLGGALSWSKPQKLAAFEQSSPFFGLSVPKDVSVKRQVLADPSQITDDVLIWARLKDGTPLVTARKMERGLLVLFHVTANSNWSDLPHSGLFVDMLRRLGQLSTGVMPANLESAAAAPATQTQSTRALTALPPLRIFDGFGDLKAPGVRAEPLKLAKLNSYIPSPRHPPGLYGTLGHTRALNIASGKLKLKALPPLPKSVKTEAYRTNSSTPLGPWFLLLALLLFLIDGLVMAFMRGLFDPASQRAGLPTAAKNSVAVLIAAFLLCNAPSPSLAAQQDIKAMTSDATALNMSLQTHLAFVRTADPEINRVNRLGLAALSRILARRTAFEPAAPVGVDISKDELAFYPLLYWALPANPRKLDSQTVARINAYMKQGGVILFDTRDQIASFMPGQNSATRTPLARLLARMDIPPLEPVPHDHVLTRSFYLLNSFPGRWKEGPMWVEATPKTRAGGTGLPARSADGVSSILITSNNLAAAWATDENGRTLFAVSPDGERQREMAYRTGVNIVMYALTGNYKADQVHLPALMRRLGQ